MAINSIFKITFKLFVIYFGFCLLGCKKDATPPPVKTIIGPTNLCPGQTNVTYYVNEVGGSDYYLWTVPEDSKILSGQGTTSITINFGKKSGSVCVRTNNGKEVGEAICIEVKQGGISNNWCQESNFVGGTRDQGVSFSIGNKGYFGTGLNSFNGLKYNDFWEFDPLENSWSQKANFAGTSRSNAVGFALNNKGYIGTGQASGAGINFLSDFWEYDPQANSWSKKAGYGKDSACVYCFAFVIGNKAYVGSGTYRYAPTTASKDFYEFNPSEGALGKWIKKSDVLIARSSGVGFAINNKGYFCTGSDFGFKDNKLMEFDPSDTSMGLDANGNPMGKWVFKTPFTGSARDGALGFSIENKGYISCGEDNINYKNDLWEYDPLSDSWVQKTSLPSTPRKYASAFVIGKNAYIGLGYNFLGNSLNDFWVFGK